MTSMVNAGRIDSLDSRASRNWKEWRSRSSGVPAQPSRLIVSAGTVTSWVDDEASSVTVTRKWLSPVGTATMWISAMWALSAVEEIAGQEVVVGAQVEQPVAGEPEQDRLGLPGLLAGAALVHCSPHGVG